MKTEIAMLKRQVTILQNDVTILQNENHTLREDNHTLRNENDLSIIENQFFKNEVARLREREFNRTHGVKGVDLMDLTN
jgi:regulator of replication initiation timing